MQMFYQYAIVSLKCIWPLEASLWPLSGSKPDGSYRQQVAYCLESLMHFSREDLLIVLHDVKALVVTYCDQRRMLTLRDTSPSIKS